MAVESDSADKSSSLKHYNCFTSDQVIKLDVNDASLQLLETVDPTFWSLENYLKVASSNSSHFQDLGYPKLIQSYVTSLCAQYLNEDNYYYDKSIIFNSSFNLIQTITKCKMHLQSIASEIGQYDLSNMYSSLEKLTEITKCLKSNTSSIIIHRVWPSETSMAKLVKYFPIFDVIFPLKKSEKKAIECIELFDNHLQVFRHTHAGLLTESNEVASVHHLFEFAYEEVMKRYEREQKSSTTTPRKRSYEFVDLENDDDCKLDSTSSQISPSPRKIRRRIRS